MAEPLHASSKLKNCFQVQMFLRKAPALFLLLLFLMIFSSNSLQAQITSKSNGDWDISETWDSGSVPTASDNVTIDNLNGNTTITVTIQPGTIVEANDLHIGQNGKLVVYGTLIVYGNLTMANNDPELVAGLDATIIIHGDAIISNKVNINLSSYFIVLGNFSIDGGGATNININDASIYVFGNFDGGNTNLSICKNYDNNTDDYKNETCHVGTDSAFFNNVEEDLISDEIIELVVACNTTASISGDNTICEGELTTIAVVLTGTSPWEITIQRNGVNDLTMTNINTNPYTFQVSEAGVYTVSAVVDANCSGTAEGSATVTVNPHPTTGEIIPD
ncbi:MAG: G8 domain-containing protein [Mariniphaga sp.]|nr:G8 domain-containing protein [Mariniphaga sp.]